MLITLQLNFFTTSYSY